MLKITLYKECILSHEYSEVFHHSIFESYLSTLNKKIIPNLDLVYYENEGTLPFDYELSSNENIYDFNYMKVDVYNDVVLVDAMKIELKDKIQDLLIISIDDKLDTIEDKEGNKAYTRAYYLNELK